jgi:hypothetical protein
MVLVVDITPPELITRTARPCAAEVTPASPALATCHYIMLRSDGVCDIAPLMSELCTRH